MTRNISRIIGVVCLWSGLCFAGRSSVTVARFEPEANVCRAGRPEAVTVVLKAAGEARPALHVRVSASADVTIVPAEGVPVWTEDGRAVFHCAANAETACDDVLSLDVETEGRVVAQASIRVCFLPPLARRRLSAIPPPEPVQTDMMIGAHNCPLWESDKLSLWYNILRHPERMPALGFYSQENPEVADWETKWAVEHGISFFLYCWYRAEQGGAVKMRYGSALHEALFKSRFADSMKFAVMWENQARGKAGVADEKDLFENLLPFWIENYFKRPSYLKVDNRPLLFIYRPEFLVQDLGGVEQVAQALDRMRRVCREHGFDGLTVLGEYRGLDPKHLRLMKALGLDYTFAYCWNIPNSPTPEQAIAKQMACIRKTQELNILPQVITVSQAWSGWHDEGSIWKIPPKAFASLLRQAKAFASTLPEGSLGRRIMLLDNWNEWGEGHYIAPYREYGFGYLDAVREVFAPQASPCVNLLPEDIGMGPYDTAIRSAMARAERLRTLARRFVVKSGSGMPGGLVGWWSFDETNGTSVAFDGSGHRLGGRLIGAARAPGMDGNALVCTGGCVEVASAKALSPTGGVTVACWVKTDVAGQTQAWIVNRIQGGGEATGFRLGLMNGCPCFSVPLTAWSHTARSAQPLPTGRWVSLAGTFDGQTVRIYMDGTLCGHIARPGRIGVNDFPLYLGSFAVDHRAHFTGLLDEVQIYDRALSVSEIRALWTAGMVFRDSCAKVDVKAKSYSDVKGP